jgi:hypothetical protein
MRLFATFVFAALLTGCPSAPAPTKADAKDMKKEAGPPADRAIEIVPAPAPGTPQPEAGASELDSLDTIPSWFDTTKIAHAKILQPINRAKVGASTATAMLLELAQGTTTADCMASVRSEMLATIPDLAEATPGEKDRLTLQGKTEGYSYTVVCGPGKDGQTTLYLSYMGL